MSPEHVALLAATCALAGVVRGFAGFGTAMIYLPVAAQVLGPFAAITTLIAMDLIGPLPSLPQALRDAHPPDIGRLLAGLVVILPVGVWGLSHTDPDMFRLLVSAVTLLLLVVLVSGLRYRGRLTPPLVYGTGGACGLLGGLTGLAGPPVILVYMASTLPAAAVRGTITAYLWGVDVAFILMFAVLGRLELSAMLLGFGLAVPYLLGNLLGAAMFRPGNERLYRAVAYAVIAASALSGLLSGS